MNVAIKHFLKIKHYKHQLDIFFTLLAWFLTSHGKDLTLSITLIPTIWSLEKHMCLILMEHKMPRSFGGLEKTLVMMHSEFSNYLFIWFSDGLLTFF
jgi:hypothetical protein